MPYFTNMGPGSGPILWRDGLVAIGVLEALGARTPIGMALLAGSDEHGLALWTLTVSRAEVPGLWVVVDRQFRPAEGLVAGLVAALGIEDGPMGSEAGPRTRPRASAGRAPALAGSGVLWDGASISSSMMGGAPGEGENRRRARRARRRYCTHERRKNAAP
jgi:hypothetical protein